MLFSRIPGLEQIKRRIIDSVKGEQVAHARLLCGPEGALALPVALANATYIHCLNRGEDSCGQCVACSKSLKYIHPDTHFVFPVRNIKEDKYDEQFRSEILKTWRNFLLEQPFGNLADWITFYGGEDKQPLISRNESREIIRTLSLKPFESHYKVMIIWLPELMHPSAANGILKILEEPSPYTYFILVSHDENNMLPTIVSRTQVISIPLLTDDEITNYLVEVSGVDGVRAKRIAQLADGNLHGAIDRIEGDGDENSQQFIEWMRSCLKKEYAQLVEMADTFHGLDRLNQKTLLIHGLAMLREALLRRYDAEVLTRAQDDEMEFLSKFSKFMDFHKLERSYKMINDAAFHLERNGSAKMIFLDLSINLAETLNETSQDGRNTR